MSVRLATPNNDVQISEDGRQALTSQLSEHKTTYKRIRDRLHGLRGYFLAADAKTQLRMLKKSYVYAVATANTAVEYADEMYGRWLAGSDPRRAAYNTPAQTNDKGRQIHTTLSEWERRAEPVRAALDGEDWRRAGELARQKLMGVSRVKGHFIVSMLTGKTACVDTHTASFLDKYATEPVSATRMSEYFGAVEALEDAVDGFGSFMAQWIAFDAERSLGPDAPEEHTLFFESLDAF